MDNAEKICLYIDNIDKEHSFLFSKFSMYCLNNININTKSINRNDLSTGKILISPYLFFKKELMNYSFRFNFDDYDLIVFSETLTPSYDTRLIGFNNQHLLDWWKQGKSDEELYEYCKHQKYKVKVVFPIRKFSLEEQMKINNIEWIPEYNRKDYEINIIDFFDKYVDNIKIDYVFPYVNMTDKEWLEEYKNTIGGEIDLQRFRDPGTLEILINLIEKNLPWVNNIFVILADTTTIPNFFKEHKKIKVVRHSEFIPKKHLPTYNSGVIESYLHMIPDLSEYFIYGNDDVYPLSPLKPNDFFNFISDVVKLTIRMVPYDTDRRPHDDLRKSDACKLLKVDDVTHVPLQAHIMSPYRKSWYEQCYNEYCDVIENAATKIRDNKRNINQYFFGYWIYINRLLIPSQIKFTSISAHKIKQHSFDNQVICLNDDNIVKDDDYKILWEIITQFLLLKLNK